MVPLQHSRTVAKAVGITIGVVPDHCSLNALLIESVLPSGSKTLLAGGEAFSGFAGDTLPRPHAPPLVRSLRRVVRIRNGHSGKHIGAPALKFFSKISGTARFALAKVFAFSDVVGQIVEFQIAAAIEILD